MASTALYVCGVHSLRSWLRPTIVVRETVDVLGSSALGHFPKRVATRSIVENDHQTSGILFNLSNVSTKIAGATTRNLQLKTSTAGADHAQTTFIATHAQIPNVDVRRRCLPRGHVSVLGKPLEQCITRIQSQIPKSVSSEDIYITIKTTQINHNARMLPLLLTWLQTVHPEQVTTQI